jgi:hypothetical protein
MSTERIIDKIKKLIRHEQSARQCSTPEEAAAFAGRISELLTRHKIERSEINLDEEPEEKVGEQEVKTGRKLRYGGGYVPLEDNCLMNVVATAHFCQAILLTGTNTMLIVGAEEDRAVVVAMFTFLRSTMKRLARREEEATRKRRLSVRKFKPHFYAGFTHAIRRRCEQLRKTTVECTALVRADALVKRYVAANHETESAKPRKFKGRLNRPGYFAGVVAGHNVDLSSNVLGGNDNANRSIS